MNINNFGKKLIRLWSGAFALPLKFVRGKTYGNVITELLMQDICRSVEKRSDVYVSSALRPKAPMNNKPYAGNSNQSVAVVLQGPVMTEDDFTLNTVRYYKECNPDMTVIVSTWNGEDKDNLNRIKEEGAFVVQSEQPVESGHRNLNYQLISTRAGIKMALNTDAAYICKTRTDQRMENPEAFSFMRNMVELYPVSGDSHFKKRIVALGAEHGSMFMPYYISDFVYFGTRDEMSLFLSIPLRNHKFPEKTMSAKTASMNKTSPESHIIKSLFEISGITYGDTIKDYWKSIKDSLVLLDMPILRIYWPKYDMRYCDHFRNGYYTVEKSEELKMTGNFNYTTWLSLMKGDIAYCEEYEEWLTKEIII